VEKPYFIKCEEGKPFRVAVIACVNKLLYWIFAPLKNKTAFQVNIQFSLKVLFNLARLLKK
jgi:hypothetical protein